MMNTDPDWKELKRRPDITYIVCPDGDCSGFTDEKMRCTNKGYFDMPVCPRKEEAYKILHCHEGHVNKLRVDYGTWHRVDCSDKSCHSSNFNLMSGKYHKVLLETIDEFLLKEFKR